MATSIPAAIYSIPPSSPLFYVTFVQIYAVSPGVVVVGYTPGYTGVVILPDGTIVYGTGYVYPAYVTATVWYPPPVTYGYAANPTYTPWTGFAMGFAIGWSAAHWCYAPTPYWGAMPYYYHPPVPYGGAYYGTAYHGTAYGAYGGAATWGPGGWAATSGNMYSHYGSTSTVSRELGRLQRVHGHGVVEQGGDLLQLHDRAHVGGAVGVRVQRLHGRLRLRKPGRHLQPQHGRERLGRQGHGGQRVHRAAGHGRARHGHRAWRPVHARGRGEQPVLRGSRREHLQLQLLDGAVAEVQLQHELLELRIEAGERERGQRVAVAYRSGDSRSASSSWGGDWGGSSSHSGEDGRRRWRQPELGRRWLGWGRGRRQQEEAGAVATGVDPR